MCYYESMMKYFFEYPYCLILAIIVASFGACNSAFAAASFERNLYVGLRADADVTRLQEFLKNEGYFKISATGNFFELTRQAVSVYQKANNIVPAAGYFGPKTRAAVNTKLSTVTAQPTNQATSLTTLEKQIAELQIRINELPASRTKSPEPVTPEPVSSTPPATTTVSQPTLPNTFDSTLKFQGLYPSITISSSSYANVTLHEFRFTAQEKLAIKRLKFKNNGTLADGYIVNLRLVHSNSGRELAKSDQPTNGIIDFVLKEDATKPDNGLMVSGSTYYIATTVITPSYGATRPFIRLDLESSASIEAFDFDDLTRKATLKEIAFPIEGPQITI